MEAILQPTPFSRFAISAPRKRSFFASTRGVTLSSVALVAALHIAAFFAWLSLPPGTPAPAREMTVSVTIAPATVPEVIPAPPPPKPKPEPLIRKVIPEPRPAPAEPVAQPVEMPVEQPSAPAPVIAETPPPVAAAPVAAPPPPPPIPDVEPDYKASYLNNPRPPYPFAARRMGLQGKVILNVEVLAEGLCGQINVHQSSGHEMLDNAAMQTVKTWKFAPARQAGHAVTKWFKIPIQFALNNNES
ncbi:MAG: energy transducer TonB [Nitrosomonadales bacterium]|nr:energy transducer TonB [Nitrosomonadales bacterium]